MTTFTSEEKLSVRLPGAPATAQGEDLETVIARLDEKWRQLKTLLRAAKEATLQEPPGPPPSLADLPQAEADDKDAEASWRHELLPDTTAPCGVTPWEADAIIKGVEKLGTEEDVGEGQHPADLPKKNYGLTVYGVFCAFLVLGMMFTAFFSQGNQASKPQAAATEEVPNPAAASSAVVPRTSPAETPKKPDGQKIPEAAGASQAAGLPALEYVGSRTSNKYHYRSCKWTKYIIPEKVRVFHSVAEARKAGYIPCPTCNPPRADEPQGSAR